MKVLQKIVRFVSMLIGILFKHFRRETHWCKQCKYSRNIALGDDEHPCEYCTARGTQFGSHWYEMKPSRFTKIDKERED